MRGIPERWAYSKGSLSLAGIPSSTAVSGLNKPNSFDAGRRAVQDYINRQGVDALVSQPDWAAKEGLGIFQTHFP